MGGVAFETQVGSFKRDKVSPAVNQRLFEPRRLDMQSAGFVSTT